MVLHKNLLGLDLHVPKDHTHIEAEITDLNHFDPDAIHTNVDDEIHAAFPVALIALADTDSFIVEVDDGGNWEKARLQWNTIKSLLETQIGGPWLPLTAGAGEQITGDLHLQGDLELDADQKIYGASGHIMAWYQSLDDSMNFGTNGDIVRLKGSALRPVYEQTPGIDVELALYSDIGGAGGAAVLRDGTLELTADWDAGPREIRADHFYADGPGAPLIVTSVNLVTNLNADLLDGEHASAFADASHTHLEADITDLQSYSLTGHTHLEADITDFDSGDYLPLAGGIMTGAIQFPADGTGIEFHDGTAYKSGVRITGGQLVIGDDLTGGDPWEILLKAKIVQVGYGANDTEIQAWDNNSSTFRTVMELVSGGDIRLGESNHDLDLQGFSTRPNYEGNALALLSDLGKDTFPIFACSSTAAQSLASGAINVEWNDAAGRRADSGYTHSITVNPDEITLDAVGWYLIMYDIGIEDTSTDGQTSYSLTLEFWDGGAWVHTANDGGYEAEARGYTEGGAGGPADDVIHGHTLWFQNEGASTKIRLRVNRTTSATTPLLVTDDECCRIYIEKKHDA